MNLLQALKMALKSLSTSKMRSFLTMLGIIIGVGSVILLTSIVGGVSTKVNDTFEGMGTNLLMVQIQGRGGNRRVNVDDMLQLADDNPDVILGISPNVTVSATVKNGTESISTSVTGVNEAYGTIKGITITSGRNICYSDVNERLHNCVIGTYIANELFGGENYMGKSLKINGLSFKIVGVVEEKADGEEGSSDEVIYIPYTLATKMSQMGVVTSYTVSATSPDTTEEAQEVIDKFMYDLFGSSDYHTVINTKEILDSLNEITGLLSILLGGVAGISLVVGGIGIMNIMLVSVTERTREIGIRKSLGATPWDIKSQFLVEAITTSAIGGILGILFGIGTSKIAEIFTSVTLSIPAMIIAFSFSAFIGIVFGYFPAKKAASLNPIDALRYD